MKARRDLEKRSADELTEAGYLVERSYMRASYRAGHWFPVHHDPFHVDMIAWRDQEIRFIQVTSTESDEATKDPTGVLGVRRRKLSALPIAPVGVSVELWLWRMSRNRWVKECYRRAEDGSGPLIDGQKRLGGKVEAAPQP